jgi:Kef-type K+ transport system membrane component KefB
LLMKKNILLYLLAVIITGVLLWFSQPVNNAFWGYIGEITVNIRQPLSILILQIIAIITCAKLLGYVFGKIGQPAVTGEIIAGIILGPSVLGWLSPETSAFLFPADSLKNLQFLSQIGLILFMFIIGLELDVSVIRAKAHVAVAVSLSSIIFPYFLGVILAYFLYPSFAPDHVSFLAFSLFMGISMSVTAFPVLARILRERNMTKTMLGAMALTCAAFNDIAAWCILAAVIAIVKAGSFTNAFFTIFLAVFYVILMIYLIQPLLRSFAARYITGETLSKTVISFVFIILLASAYISEIIGIHVLFGAFLAGVIISETLELKNHIIEKIEDVSLVLLLPLFFVLTGLRTEVALLGRGSLWLVFFIIILLAVTGKFAGTAIAARMTGQSWKDSLALGALMNTRGLMELIILNIGYELKVLTPEVFAMMVLMALVTTFMTGPLLNFLQVKSKEERFNHE